MPVSAKPAVPPKNGDGRVERCSGGREFGGIELNGKPELVPDVDAYRLEMENLSDAILGRAKPLLGRADALGQARVIDALLRSAASGEAVSIAS